MEENAARTKTTPSGEASRVDVDFTGATGATGAGAASSSSTGATIGSAAAAAPLAAFQAKAYWTRRI